jgi:hypothetical protein
MTISSPQDTPPFLKQSRAKIWIRTGILTVFGALFGLSGICVRVSNLKRPGAGGEAPR